MDPNACIDRIRRALDGLDLDEAGYACDDLYDWLRKGGFPPTNFERIAGFTETSALVKDIAARIVADAGTDARTWPWVHDIANPRDFERDGMLYCVRVDDRGDLCVYVWGGTETDAVEAAEEHARKQDWQFNEEDIAVFGVEDDARVIVLVRSIRA